MRFHVCVFETSAMQFGTYIGQHVPLGTHCDDFGDHSSALIISSAKFELVTLVSPQAVISNDKYVH